MSHYPYTYSPPVATPGWLCPRCNTVNAPTTPYCYRCAPPGAQVAKDTTSADSPWINRFAPEDKEVE